MAIPLLVALGCTRDEPAPTVSTEPATTTVAPSVTPPPPPPAPPPSPPRVCPDDMELVAGSYCPRVVHRCVEKKRIGHCLRYAEPECRGERVPMRLCMDRYEWPNQKGQLPRTLTSWPTAQKLCASVGKRLCTMDEWQFACEGEGMKAHVYGNTRDDSKCNFDRPYIERTYDYDPWDACQETPACKAEYDRLDQRKPAGSMASCVSDHGIYDLNGNANEWVVRTDQRPPRRSGLKGGWWGPVRNRCRPMTTFHLEGDYGYEVGFRCCRDAPPAAGGSEGEASGGEEEL